MEINLNELTNSVKMCEPVKFDFHVHSLVPCLGFLMPTPLRKSVCHSGSNSTMRLFLM